jgi:hypothetical protein
VEKFVLETGNLRDHVSRLNHRADAETSSVTCMKLAFDKVTNNHFELTRLPEPGSLSKTRFRDF